MGLAARLERLVPDLSTTLLRFPVPALLSAALCVYVNAKGMGGGDQSFNVAVGASAAFFASGAAHLFAEGRTLPRGISFILAIAAAAGAGIAGYLTKVFDTNLLFLFAGLVPLVMIAPFLKGGVEQGAIWLFNLRFGLAALLATIVALIFALGLSGIVEALNTLFGAGLHSDFHEHIWIAAISLVAPIYGLALMPKSVTEGVDLDAQKGTLLERGVSVLINYVLAPIVIIYAVILHAYAVKIIIDGELPRGQIATMVSIFAIGGTGAWLVAWPWRERGTWLLKFFMRWWFFLLVVPAVLLVIAIWRRISDYGVTPERYAIALAAVWVAAIAVYLAVRRNRADMRAMLGTFAALMIFGATGPMGANGLTVSSQFERLIALLEVNGVLKDGQVVPQKKLLPSEAASQGHSIIFALKDAGGLDRLRGWFAEGPDNPFTKATDEWGTAQLIVERFGFAPSYQPAEYVSFNANVPASVVVPLGARLVGPMQAIQNYNKQEPQKLNTANFDNEQLAIKLESGTYRFSQVELLNKVKERLAQDAAMQEPVSIDMAPGITLLIDNLFGSVSGNPPLGSARFWIILQPQP